MTEGGGGALRCGDKVFDNHNRYAIFHFVDSNAKIKHCLQFYGNYLQI